MRPQLRTALISFSAIAAICVAACGAHTDGNQSPATSSAGPAAKNGGSAATGGSNGGQSRCGQIDGTAVPGILGVTSLQPLNTWHETANNADVLLCVYSGTGILAPSLKYTIYSPASIGLDAQYASMTANPMLHADERAFSSGVGLASIGKAGGSSDVGFHAQVIVKTNSNIAIINVSGLGDAEAAKAAVLKAAALL